nr:uncharacterized protein LOC119177945 [Rhipicephalus microplus]
MSLQKIRRSSSWSKKFDEYFTKQTNIVYESACFHKWHQMPGESIDQFMTALHILAEKCDFGGFKGHLIRDRFVFGLRDKKLSESLQMDPELSLATALVKARLKETVQQQQAELRNSNEVHDSTQFNLCQEVSVETMGHRMKPCHSEDTRPPALRFERQCIFCGGHSRARTDCPARAQECFNCVVKGRFGKWSVVQQTLKSPGPFEQKSEQFRLLQPEALQAQPQSHFV